MPILYGHLPEHDCNWMALAGEVTCKHALDYPDGLDPSRPDITLNWVVFVDPRADLSDITAECMLDLHRKMKPVARALAERGTIRTVWVCDAPLNLTFISAWRAYINADPDYPSTPRLTRGLGEACDLIGLAPEAGEAIRQTLWAHGVGLGVL